MESTQHDGESLKKEVTFTVENAVHEFEAAFLHYADAVHGDEVLDVRTKWLENNIIW